MNAHSQSSDSACFQALLGGHDTLMDALTDVATLADALLLDPSNPDAFEATYRDLLVAARDIAAHLDEEEHGIFPALQASGVNHETILMLERDHSSLRSMIHDIGQLDPTSLRAPRRLAHLVHAFVDYFEWHTEREETLAKGARRDSQVQVRDARSQTRSRKKPSSFGL